MIIYIHKEHFFDTRAMLGTTASIGLIQSSRFLSQVLVSTEIKLLYHILTTTGTIINHNDSLILKKLHVISKNSISL